MFEFDREKFSARLRLYTNAAGGPGKVSKKSGVNYHTLTKWLSGENVPTVDKLAKLAIVCNVSVEELVTGNKPLSAGTSLTDLEIVQVVKSIAVQLASLEDSGIDYEPEEFGEAFAKVLKFKLNEEASDNEMNNIIKFQFASR